MFNSCVAIDAKKPHLRLINNNTQRLAIHKPVITPYLSSEKVCRCGVQEPHAASLLAFLFYMLFVC